MKLSEGEAWPSTPFLTTMCSLIPTDTSAPTVTLIGSTYINVLEGQPFHDPGVGTPYCFVSACLTCALQALMGLFSRSQVEANDSGKCSGLVKDTVETYGELGRAH